MNEEGKEKKQPETEEVIIPNVSSLKEDYLRWATADFCYRQTLDRICRNLEDATKRREMETW